MEKVIQLLIKKTEYIDREVRIIVQSMHPDFDFSDYNVSFAEVEALFSGEKDGYERCDTAYHDWGHTMGVVLATVRLLHGVHVERQHLSPRIIGLALTAALFHDAGYIRRSSECNGTGAQFTRSHVDRGLAMLEAHAEGLGWPISDFMDMESMVLCTDPTCAPESVLFTNIEAMLAGHVLSTADIVAQMADDIYLEKLPLLFLEFTEGGITDFSSEYDLFMKTMGFYAFMRSKLENRLSNVIRYMAPHFRERHGVERDFYSEAIERNMRYLATILERHGTEYAKALRRRLDRDEHPITVAA